MKSLRMLLILGTIAAGLLMPARAFGQINLSLPKGGAVQVADAITAKDADDKVVNHPCKIYTIDLVGGKIYQIDMMQKADKAGNKIDPFLRLEDADGKELAKDDDGGEGLNARIVIKAPQNGKYRIIATTFGGGTGLYNLSVKALALAKATDIALVDGKIEVKGVLAKEDPKDTSRKNSACKVFTLKLSAGKTYQIDMMSKDIDSYLRIENADGKELARDDDGGDGLNARIVFNCPTDGTYRVVATTFVGGAGPFTLTVNQK